MPSTRPWWNNSLFRKLRSTNEQQKYSKVNEHSDSEDGLPTAHHSRPFLRQYTMIIVFTIIWFLTIILTIWLCSMLPIHTYVSLLAKENTTDTIVGLQEYNHTPCGSTAKEATDNGCIYEIMSHCWLPPACHDEELEKEFLENNWHFYIRNGHDPTLQEISASEVKTGKHFGVHISLGNHITHCWYMERKLQRSLMKGGYIDSYIGNLGHVHHCGEILLHKAAGLPRDGPNGTKVEMPEWNEISDQATIRYPACDEYRRMAKNEGFLIE